MENRKRKREFTMIHEPDESYIDIINTKKRLFNKLIEKPLMLKPPEDLLIEKTSGNKQQFSWRLPSIYTILEMCKNENNNNCSALKNIAKLLNTKYKHHYIHLFDLKKYSIRQAAFSDAKKKIDWILFNVFINDNFAHLIKAYDKILENKDRDDLKLIFRKWYRDFLFLFNVYMKVLKKNDIKYENWVKDLIKATYYKYPELTLEQINEKFLFMGLFEYFHPIRNQYGEFEYCQVFLDPDSHFLVD